MLLGTLLQGSHCGSNCTGDPMAEVEDLLCAMMMISPMIMPFVWGVLFSMHLVNSKETKVVSH
jgi:hypothetical protein